MQHHAARRGEQHHAVGVGDLVVQRLHDRRSVLEQETVFIERITQIAAQRARKVRGVVLAQAERRRAPMGLADQVRAEGAGNRG